jgi:ABC-2 type transport system permease protein
VNWEQLRAILWLRWRLTINQFGRGGPLNAVLSVVILAAIVVAAVGAGIGGIALGYFASRGAPPQVMLLAWDGIVLLFLAIWTAGLLVEIQRSESLDLARLLHLPVTLSQVFVINYAAAHFSPILAIMVPGMVGVCVGMVLNGGWQLLLLLPLVLGFVFMVTAWTYCLRGWLASLMVNKRKRRGIIVWMTLTLVLMGQIPNLVVNNSWFRHRVGEMAHAKHAAPGTTPSTSSTPSSDPADFLPAAIVQAHPWIPVGWPGIGALELERGHPSLPIGLTAACWLIGVLGVWRAYRLTLRFYLGAGGGETAVVSVKRPAVVRGRMLVERKLPWLPDDTAALALMFLRSLLRSPEMKMALVMPVVLCAVFSSVLLSQMRLKIGIGAAGFISTGVAVVSCFSLSPAMANMFGVDRDGFRGLVLLPTRRRDVLLAKNLAYFPFVAVITGLLMAAVGLLLHVPWELIAVGLIQAPAAYLLAAQVCNLLSILAPYRIAAGSLKAQKPKAIVAVAALASMFSMPLVLSPISIPPLLRLLFRRMGWLPWLPIDLLAATAVLIATITLYWFVLPAQGRLLQRREQSILREVTEATE